MNMKGLVFFALCGVMACGALEQVAEASVSQVPDEGFVRVTQAGWNVSGTPPVVKFCLRSEEKPGLITNSFTCSQWGSAQSYLDRRFPGMGVKLTRWEYQCEAIYQNGCAQRIVLYYRVSN